MTNYICACCGQSTCQLRRENFSASSFYPGRGDNTHPLAHLDQGKSVFHTPDVDDDDSETEEDPTDDEPAVELSLKHPSKFSESLAIEVSLLSSTVLLTDDCFHRGHLGQGQVVLNLAIRPTRA